MFMSGLRSTCNPISLNKSGAKSLIDPHALLVVSPFVTRCHVFLDDEGNIVGIRIDFKQKSS